MWCNSTGQLGFPTSFMDITRIIDSIQNMRTSHKILLILSLLLLTNIVTFMLSTSFQQMAKFDDEFDYHIYDSQDYEHSYSYIGSQELGEFSSAVVWVIIYKFEFMVRLYLSTVYIKQNNKRNISL